DTNPTNTTTTAPPSHIRRISQAAPNPANNNSAKSIQASTSHPIGQSPSPSISTPSSNPNATPSNITIEPGRATPANPTRLCRPTAAIAPNTGTAGASPKTNTGADIEPAPSAAAIASIAAGKPTTQASQPANRLKLPSPGWRKGEL